MNQPVLATLVAAALSLGAAQEAAGRFELLDVFELEYASDPQIAPDGSRVVYVRNFMDVMHDARRSNLWSIDFDGGRHRPWTSGNRNHSSPRWSPAGDRVLYVASGEGSSQIHVRWMDSGETAKLTNLTHAPSALTWSPDGVWIAFAMHVPEPSEPYVALPPKPEGAEWAPEARVIRGLLYRADGAGYLREGYQQLFLLPAEGGTPRQLTSGPHRHGGPLSFTPDGASLVFSANRHAEGEFDPLNTEVYAVDLASGVIRALTDRAGPDREPRVSPDGTLVAYVGFDDRQQGYQVARISLTPWQAGARRELALALDRNPRGLRWAADGQGLYFQYDDRGNTHIAHASLAGNLSDLASQVGGTSLGRPYSGGSFSVARNGRFAFTHTTPAGPAGVAVGEMGSAVRILTSLNADLFGHKALAQVEEIWVESSFDGRRIQGWIAKPPDFDAARRWPLLLEIHGGPFANYGPRFSAEVQLYAAAGYVVLYTNPRGSTSYGEEFGNLIHHNYPGQDYDDLMSAVDAVIAKGYVDADQLYVTGGSGGGVLTSWIVGKTDRFRAAVVAKPVINWTSFVLTSDVANFFYKYWFPGLPWDHQEQYARRSPLSLVGNVTTPTMLLTGELDYRTPIAESEQYYQALKLRRIDTALVRIPEASHSIAARPSHLIAKVAHILQWFKEHDGRTE